MVGKSNYSLDNPGFDNAEASGPVISTKVAHVNSQTTINLQDEKSPIPGRATKPYAGMGKEDLLRFSQTPFWNRLRLACVIIFWVGWLALLAAVIGLTIVFPRCKAPPSQAWWQNSVIHQVYARSFFDSDGDGVGDIKGIESKLDYVKELKADAVLISSVYESHSSVPSNQNKADYGYDVKDHTNISSEYGGFSAIRSLIKSAHDKGLKIIMDFIPNHTGNQHEWFEKSRKGTSPYRNYYVWANCTDSSKPNNWLSVYGNSSWTYDSVRKECYLHQFMSTQPDLNLRSALVQKELEDILRFWLAEGVDGFRVMSIAHLFEDYDLRDEPPSNLTDDKNDYRSLHHIHTYNLPEVHDMVARWRALVDEESAKPNNKPRILITDADGNTSDVMAYYTSIGRAGAHLPLNFGLVDLSKSCNAACIRKIVDAWWTNMPANNTATWMSGFQDSSRVNSPRGLGPVYVNALNLLLMTLPGTVFTYYGEEIGMTNGNLTLLQTRDPIAANLHPNTYEEWSRDPYRTPMQWQNGSNAGFVNGSRTDPWLPINKDYNDVNVQMQNTTKNKDTAFQAYKAFSALHRLPSVQYGEFKFGPTTDNIISYIRQFNGKDRIFVAINFGQKEETHNYNTEFHMVAGEAQVLETTRNGVDYKTGSTISTNGIKLQPGQGIVFKWPYSR